MLKILEPGVYILTEDVQNPKPDRRSKDWDKLPVWKKGTVLFQQHRKDYTEFVVPGKLIARYMREGFFPSDPQYQDLARACVRIEPEKPSAVLIEQDQVYFRGVSASDVLDALFRAGKVSLDDVREAHADAHASPISEPWLADSPEDTL